MRKKQDNNQSAGWERTRRMLARDFLKCMRRAVGLIDKIDEAFEGNPFDRNHPPDHRKNIRRFPIYMALHLEVFRLCDEARKRYLQASGVGQSSGWQMGSGYLHQLRRLPG